MRKTTVALALALITAGTASAGFVSYAANPTSNSTDFAAGVATYGQTLNTLDFETHPLGTLNSTFYPGVTIAFGNTTNVTTELASQGGLTSPQSTGEGAGDASHHLTPDAAYTMTITFDTPVLAAGFFLIDFYNPSGVNGQPFIVYDGPNGTGNVLGSVTPAPYNFQINNKYFLGALSTDGDIRSIRFSSTGFAGDSVYIDNIQYSTTGTPEPGTWLLLASGGLLVVMKRRRA